jgi:ABC-type polysaccharide/polyol phosphate transport system ATPase subunit
MTNICVKAEKLSKRFYIRQTPNTALQTLKGLVGGGIPKKELWVLNNISFEIQKGQKVAVVGKNGSGKTTLLRILAGIYRSTSGHLQVRSEPRVLFNFLAGLIGDLTVLDNLFLFGAIHGIPRAILKERVDAILRLTELESLKFCSLKELSRGQQQRLALGVFFENKNDFFIFDEGLSFIDQGFSRAITPQLQNFFAPHRTVIIASHDDAFLRRYCDTALWLEAGEIRMYDRLEKVLSEYEKASR